MGCGGRDSGRGFVAKGFPQGQYLEQHFRDHKENFHAKMTITEYNNRAKKLLNTPVGGSIKGFTDEDGRVYRYNSETNEFAKCRPDGIIITFFKPASGKKYWQGQVDKNGI